eukprot:g75641.t1
MFLIHQWERSGNACSSGLFYTICQKCESGPGRIVEWARVNATDSRSHYSSRELMLSSWSEMAAETLSKIVLDSKPDVDQGLFHGTSMYGSMIGDNRFDLAHDTLCVDQSTTTEPFHHPHIEK